MSHGGEWTLHQWPTRYQVLTVIVGSKKPFKPRVRRVHETPQPDADGWVTLNKKKQSFGADEATQQRDTFRESAKADTTQVRVRPNNKKIGSNKPSDPRDILDQTKSTFNAFAALGDESDDSDEDEDEDEEKENDDWIKYNEEIIINELLKPT